MLPRGLLKEYAFTLSIVARLIDVFAVLIGAVISYWWRFDDFEFPTIYRIVILLGLILTPFIFDTFHIYDSWRGKNQIQHFRSVLLAWATVALLLIILGFLSKTSDMYSRQWVIAWAISVAVALVIFRFLLMLLLRLIRRNGLNSRQIAIFGAGRLGQSVFSNINEAPWSGLIISAFFDDDITIHGSSIHSINVLGGLDKLIQSDEESKFDEIWITLPLRSEYRVREIMKALKHSTITIRYVPDIYGFRLLNHSVTEVAGIPVIDISSSPMVGLNRLIKALEDRVFAALIFILISPVLLLIAILIKLTSNGPVLFKQMRHGWDGELIKIYKFRTMYVHQEKDGVVTQAITNDSRITKLGSFLRKTSLDELPQFFNVLQGKMSIVGPRPHAVAHNDEYKNLVDGYMTRHKVKPGITGWAQVNGFRGETDTLEKMEKRIEYDLFYIENWSLWFDAKIIIMTVFNGFVNKNAY